jgi:hypothetical protein
LRLFSGYLLLVACYLPVSSSAWLLLACYVSPNNAFAS